jgi:S1-C subfamily serine protease
MPHRRCPRQYHLFLHRSKAVNPAILTGNLQMSLRVHTVLLSVFLFSISSFAQTTQRQLSISKATSAKDNQVSTSQSAPKGWVWVTQTIDLSQQLLGENIMTLDGEPVPSMKRLRVTLGLVIDDQGHIVTRLIDVYPKLQPLQITVRGSGNVTRARFLGMDAVTGLCVLKADDPTLKMATFAAISTFPARLNIRLYGFHPKQASNLGAAMTSGYPRRNFYNGQIVKTAGSSRFNNNIPLYHLISPQLTAAQDCSLILDKGDSVFGLAFYSIGGQGPHLVYPIAQILSIVQPVIRSNQSIAHGWLGASGRDIQAPANTQATEYSGVRLDAVAPDSPADVAGVKAQDILLSVNNRRVENWSQLASIMQKMPADSEVMLRVKRGDEYKQLRARLAPAPAIGEEQVVTFARKLETMEKELESMSPTDPNRLSQESKVGMMRNFVAFSAGPAPPVIRLRVFYGLEVQPLTGQLLRYFAATSGVLVTNVSDNNKAARSGLMAGDIILKVGDVQIDNPPGLLKALDQKTPGEITVSRRRELLKIEFLR